MAENQNHLPTTKFQKRHWHEIKAENSWTMFKVISEFVDGFERLNNYGPCVSIFGSARTKPDQPHYKMATEIARLLTDEGWGVITGGGPGIMEAGNKGASLNNGTSIGLNIHLPFEQNHNPFIDSDKNFEYNYFFVRKVMFVKYAQAFVIMPGGFGTMDEMFEVLTLIQTDTIDEVPVILFDSSYWGGLIDWIKSTMLGKANNIKAKDLDLFSVVDTAEEVVSIIRTFHQDGEHTKPNYDLDSGRGY
ncbi:MAG TPA: TIGR00730 family Rossman fold protein [Bacteroidetes bacterium]|nr:TIGR00730 family Rossman fold protein [Bacteroidota bacterium]